LVKIHQGLTLVEIKGLQGNNYLVLLEELLLLKLQFWLAVENKLIIDLLELNLMEA
jgi:hypothetical protein